MLKMVVGMEVLGRRQVERQRKTWRRTVQEDLKMLGVGEEIALTQENWLRMVIANPTLGAR